MLQLGNVANYAYVNAKLMRRAGVECDVADPDFYHIMATPEWYEGDFQGGHGADDFFPKWSATDLGRFDRPRYFAQGPGSFVWDYLNARWNGGDTARRETWRRLELSRRVVSRDLSASEQLVLSLKRGARNVLFAPAAAAARAVTLLRRGGRAFPDSPALDVVAVPPEDLQTPLTLGSIRAEAHRITPALRAYDIIQGFTLSAVFPAALELENYVACELGTLRGLPFEESEPGLLTRWLYGRAPFVFVTNSDCVSTALRIGIPADRVIPVLHPFDVDEAVAFALRPAPVVPGVPVVVVPARHHWTSGNASWRKGNDVIIRALGEARRRGAIFSVRLFEWGEDVAASRALLREQGLEDVTVWSPPLPRKSLWNLYRQASLVIDQYGSGSLGGVALETMALGRRLLTHADLPSLRVHFRTPPPLLAAGTEAELSQMVVAALQDPHDQAGLGSAAQAWMMAEHGVTRQLAESFSIYDRLLQRTG